MRGRCGTNSHPPSFCMASVAQSHIHLRFASFCVAGVVQTATGWRAWPWFRRPWRRDILRGRRGTNSHLLSLCVAGVVQLTSTVVLRGRRGTDGTGWRAWPWFRRPWRRDILRGRRGTNSHLLTLCVAGVVQLTSTVVLRGRRGTDGTGWRAWPWFRRPWRRGILRGRRGTNSHPPLFCMAGVAQSHIHLRFAWQAWHSWDWVARLGRFGRGWRRGTLRGRRGTTSHPPSFCMAGVAQSHIHLRFARQAWYRWHWVARLALA